jgi:hypothetical protein
MMPLLLSPLDSRRLRFAVVSLAAIMLTAPLSRAQSVAPSTGGTIGLVLTYLQPAMYESPGGKVECPNGLNVGDRDNSKAQPDFDERMKRFGSTSARGPNGEGALFDPDAVEDPLPYHEVESKIWPGLNLDGAADGKASPKTCPHPQFTSPDGEPGIDNQLGRVLGCIIGWRSGGASRERIATDVTFNHRNRLLFEITGVRDEKNDPAVMVHIYKGYDPLVAGPDGKARPFLSQRIDSRFPQYSYEVKGKIVDGVLITEPLAHAKLPKLWVRIAMEWNIRDLQLKVKLSDTGADGILGGYEGIDDWFSMLARGGGLYQNLSSYSPAGLWRSLHRNADGYPDPNTGQCTAISAGYEIHLTRAFIVHPHGS